MILNRAYYQSQRDAAHTLYRRHFARALEALKTDERLAWTELRRARAWLDLWEDLGRKIKEMPS